MASDEEHLRLLSIFHYVMAGIAGLFSLLPILHITMGLLMLSGRMDSPNDMPGSRVFGLMMVLMGATFIACGLAYAVCVAFAGHFISERRRHLFCIIMAGLSCAFFPFGTVLGVFTITVLQRDSVRHMFGRT